MNLVLIGYRGTGKTTISNQLGERLGWPVYHTDELLVERFGRSIPDYVAEHGWEAFRDEEEAVVAELCAKDRVVIDAGGGVVVREGNVEALRRNGFVVWLQAAVETLARRIGGDPNRPSLTGAADASEEIADVLTARTPLYQKAAHCTVVSDGQSAQQCAERIVRLFEEIYPQ
ncbi:MAG: AAA family ATPase [bacterium]|nr:AAA family ATPase [bacterium]